MDRLPALLASAAMGVYVLIVVGATTAGRRLCRLAVV